jgi:hypothetical protein
MIVTLETHGARKSGKTTLLAICKEALEAKGYRATVHKLDGELEAMVIVREERFRYMAKPVEVEAVKASVAYGDHDPADVPWWLRRAIIAKDIDIVSGVARCNTKQGPVQVDPTEDMLIRLEDGEIYPCKIEVFEKKYVKI